jgi:beta-glucosidase/6-phospho-beta-glucosidase/beta-galactosidase
VTVDDELVKLLSPSWVVSSTGKSESIWDRFVHEGNNIENGWTGDVACDSYHKWEEDIKLLVEMGVLYLTLERIDVRYHLNWFLS